MTVFVVHNLENDSIVSINKSEFGARMALLNFLRNETGYIEADWQEFADNNGFDDIEEFWMEILECDDYDEELEMLVEEIEVNE